MLPVRMVRSLLVFGESITNPFLPKHPIPDFGNPNSPNSKTLENKGKTRNHPYLLFTPTREVITDTYRLASLSRDIGLDFCPNPSLSHLLFSWSPPTSLPNNAVPLPFPSLTDASVPVLGSFARLSKGFFKLVFLKSRIDLSDRMCFKGVNWDSCSALLVSRRNGDRIDSMEGFSRVLAGAGWTFFKTNNRASSDSGSGRIYGSNPVYLFRKVDFNRIRTKRVSGDGGGGPSGECRVRELRLPQLDFVNAPLRILQYILLMTDDIFYLA